MLSLIRKQNVSLSRIESRPSKTKGNYDFFIDFNASSAAEIERIKKALDGSPVINKINVISGDKSDEPGMICDISCYIPFNLF